MNHLKGRRNPIIKIPYTYNQELNDREMIYPNYMYIYVSLWTSIQNYKGVKIMLVKRLHVQAKLAYLAFFRPAHSILIYGTHYHLYMYTYLR